MKAKVRAKLKAMDSPLPAGVELPRRHPHDKKIKDLIGVKPEDIAPANKKEFLSLERMINLKLSGLTYSEVGKVMGCSEENVVKRLTPYRDTIAGLKTFQDNKADIYDFHQTRILDGIDEKKIKDAKLYDLIRSAGQLEDMGRKVRGLDAHTNINVFSLTVKAAYPVPGKKGVLLEGKVDSGRSAEELPGGVLGTGIPQDVCPEVLPEVPRYRDLGEDVCGNAEASRCGEGDPLVLVHGEGGIVCAPGEEG